MEIITEVWKENVKEKIITGLNQALDGIDEYVSQNGTTDDLQRTVKMAVDKLNFMSEVIYDQELDRQYAEDGLKINWIDNWEVVKRWKKCN